MRWVEARPGAAFLGHESCILMKQMEPDDWLPGGIGEVAESPRITTLQYAPRGLASDHVCGTAEEFRQGGVYAPDLPPVLYDSNGYPRCCSGPKKVRGGAGAGGHATIVIEPAVVPGVTCADAGVIALDTWYTFTHSGVPGANDWFNAPGSYPPGLAHIEIDPLPSAADVRVRFGTSCVNGAPLSISNAGGCTTVGLGFTAASMYVTVGCTSLVTPFVYRFRVGHGAC